MGLVIRAINGSGSFNRIIQGWSSGAPLSQFESVGYVAAKSAGDPSGVTANHAIVSRRNSLNAVNHLAIPLQRKISIENDLRLVGHLPTNRLSAGAVQQAFVP
jgi:hypothetical protein